MGLLPYVCLPYFLYLIQFKFISNSIICLFSVGGVKAVACSKESVTQPTHLECLTNYLNQWETKETWNGTTMFTSPSSLNMLAQLLDYTYPCEVSGSKLDFEPIKFTPREGVIKYSLKFISFKIILIYLLILKFNTTLIIILGVYIKSNIIL